MSDTTNTSKKLFSGKRASDRRSMKFKKLDKKRARMLKFEEKKGEIRAEIKALNKIQV